MQLGLLDCKFIKFDKFIKVAIYVYFDEIQTPSIQDQKAQDGRLRTFMEYFL